MGVDRIRVDSPHPDVYRIRVWGFLDTTAGARILRQVDARLALLDDARVRAGHILADLAGVAAATSPGLSALRHATYATARRGVGFHLVGAGHLAARAGVRAHAVLEWIGQFPDLPAALDTLVTAPDHRDGGRSSHPRRGVASPSPRSRG